MTADKIWHLYIIRCADNSLYTGIAIDVDKRFAEHQKQGANCAKYLRGRSPLVLAYQESVGSRGEASRREYAIKQLSKREKEALLANFQN